MATGLDPDRLGELRSAIERDVEAGLYHGGVIYVSRGGELGLQAAVGNDRPGGSALAQDSVFSLLSLTKAFTNTLVLRAIERGQLALTTRIAEVIEEFTGAPRDQANLFHLLTHTAGMPGVWEPRPGMFQDQLDELVAAVCTSVHGVVEPGTRCDYAPVVNHTLMAEMLRRTDPQGRDFITTVNEDLFGPLGLKDTSMGVRPDLRERKVVADMRGTVGIEVRGRRADGPYGMFEQEVVEAPHVGAVSTAGDIWRFAEMLRQGGTLDGARILSPRTIAVARRNWTGDMFNEIYRGVALRERWDAPPAYIGLGFSVRGPRLVAHQFGTFTTPETFGNYGAGSTMFWVDPELDMSFVCLTAGLLPQGANIARFQRLSDLAVSAAT